MVEASGRPRVPVAGFAGLMGYSNRDVTAPVGIRNRNWGAATSDIAVGVHRPLEVSALVLADRGQKQLFLLATWDNCMWYRADDWYSFQARVLEELGLAEDQFVINLSHTHSGVHTCSTSIGLAGGAGLLAYMDSVATAVIEAARDAIAGLRRGTIEWTAGHSEVAANRDLLLDGEALVGWNPSEVADPTVLVGRLTLEDGSPFATLVNYACHGTTLGPENLLLSPDYVGALRETVKWGTGAPCVFFQGSSGDTAPREQYSGDTSLADRHGRAIGYAVLAALETLPPPGTDLALTTVVESGAPLAYWTPQPATRSGALSVEKHLTTLPLRALSTMEDLEHEWAEILPQSRDERLRRARNLRDGYIDLENRPDSVDHQLWVARIGDALLVAHPGETYNWFQVELRRRFPGVPVLVLGNSNGGGHVYLPDARAYERNTYPAWQTVLGEGSLEMLADAATEALRRLP